MVVVKEVERTHGMLHFLIESAYRQVSQEEGCNINSIHRSLLCIEISGALKKKLRAYGVKEAEEYSTDFIPLIPNHHWILIPDVPNADLVKNPHADGMVIDPTWQQFITTTNSDPPDSFPKALICRRSQLPKTLSEFGLEGDKQLPWLAALPQSYLAYLEFREEE